MRVRVLKTGDVRVSPYLPFGGDNCNIIKASGITTPKSKWLWLPVFSFLIEHPKANILVDTGWSRQMSPDGVFDKKAQIKSLGSRLLYLVNQGKISKGESIPEQLDALGLKASNLDYVLLTHLDCDHANGLDGVKNAKNIICSKDELECAKKNSFVRYKSKWWRDVNLKTFEFTSKDGPFNKSYDLFGDGSVLLVNIPGHSDGLFAVKITHNNKFVLLFSDGGYATKSWKEMITSGIALDKVKQRKSLEWIREQALMENCIASFASHDADVKPQVIEF